MAAFAVALVFAFLFYLVLSAGSGNYGFWAPEEIAFGAIFAVVAALFAKRLFSASGIMPDARALNPKRWLFFVLYAIGPLFFGMARANIDVSYRLITGRIRPGIVKISPGLKTDFGTAMLANGITLTPGTLSVDVDGQRNIYVHCINVKSKGLKTEEICPSFAGWIRRITE
jgi:multicomponent Na+:H+ antiporter subunit E